MFRVFALAVLLIAFGARDATALAISDTPAPADTPLTYSMKPKPLAHCKAASHQRAECKPAKTPHRPAHGACHWSASAGRCL